MRRQVKRSRAGEARTRGGRAAGGVCPPHWAHPCLYPPPPPPMAMAGSSSRVSPLLFLVRAGLGQVGSGQDSASVPWSSHPRPSAAPELRISFTLEGWFLLQCEGGERCPMLLLLLPSVTHGRGRMFRGSPRSPRLN